MKTMRKILSIALVLTMVLALSIPAMADDVLPDTGPDKTNTYTLTITGSAGYTFTAYQIFQGKFAELEDHTKYLSNISWADAVESNPNLKTAIITAVLGDAYNPATTYTADDIAKSLGNSADKAKALGDAVAPFVSGETPALPSAGEVTIGLPTGGGDINPAATQGTITPLHAGYYYVKTTPPTGVTPTNIFSIVNVVDNAEITAKVEDQPKVDKTVDDINDSTTDPVVSGETADHDINDQVTFKLSTTLPSNVTTIHEDKTYPLVLRDQMTPGLSLKDGFGKSDLIVKIGGVDVDPNDYDLDVKTINDANNITPMGDRYANGTQILISFDDVVALGAHGSDEVYVEYKAKLNEQAVIGNPGNLNAYRVEYGHELDQKTEWDVTTVFTLSMKVNKIKGSDGKPLGGAEFVLEKHVYNKETGAYSWERIDPTKGATPVQGEDPVADSNFTFTGLDDGHYRLTETKAPAGYNGIDPIYLEVVTEHSETGETGTLTSITVREMTDATFTQVKGNGNSTSYTITLTENAVANIETSIENNQGVVLPSTGGMGTTIFYVVGAVLMLGAMVLLVSKKRVE